MLPLPDHQDFDRQIGLIFIFFLIFAPYRRVERPIPGEDGLAPVRAEHTAFAAHLAGDVHRDGFYQRGSHLAGNKTLPDQLV